MSEDLKRKLTSRKFWATVATFVTMLLTALGTSQNQAAQVAAIIMAGAAVVAYVVGEGLVDSASVSSETKTTTETTVTQIKQDTPATPATDDSKAQD